MSRDAEGIPSAPASFWDDAEIVSVYSTNQAIEDGVLVDVTQHFAKLSPRPKATARFILSQSLDHELALTGNWPENLGYVWDAYVKALLASEEPEFVSFEFPHWASRRTIWGIVNGSDDPRYDIVLTFMFPEDY